MNKSQFINRKNGRNASSDGVKKRFKQPKDKRNKIDLKLENRKKQRKPRSSFKKTRREDRLSLRI